MYLNEDGSLGTLIYDDYEYSRVGNDEEYHNLKNDNIEAIKFGNRENKPREGVILYGQYNPKRNERILIGYEQTKTSERGYIWKDNLHEPYIIQIFKNVNKKTQHVKTYMPVTIDAQRTPLVYSLATIKDYGLIEFLKNGPYELQRDTEITRYYRNFKTMKNGYALSTFPFGRQYTLEEINNMLSNAGYNTEIPELIINIYNGTDHNKNEKETIIAAIEQAKKEGIIIEDKGLTLIHD